MDELTRQSRQDFSLVLKGGTVIDGSGRPRMEADIGIDGDTIYTVDPKGHLRGEETLDCRGLIVAPGFIDTHSHSDLMVLSDPSLPMKVRQGITLEVFGQDGISVAPVRSADKPQLRRQLAGLLGDPPLEWNWNSVGEYLSHLERTGAAFDRGYLVPHGAVRQWVVGSENRPAKNWELRQMVDLVDQGMAEGALGLSTGLIYPPCCYAETDELVALCRVVAARQGVFVVHMRSESDVIVEAVAEMIDVGRLSGVHVHISHFKIAGQQNWAEIGKVLNMIHEAQTQNIHITADQYPYIAGSTMLGAILPPWAHDGGVDATRARLSDPAIRAQMRQEMARTEKCSWDNFWKWSGPEGIRIADIPSGRQNDLIGNSLAEAAALRDQDPFEFAFDLLRTENMGVAMVSFSQSETVVERIMREPYVNVCTDGLLGGKPHPRAFGTYPRILARYVRERSILTLEEAIRKMTSQAAQTFRLPGYGAIQPACHANLVVFDAANVQDEATFENPVQYPSHITHVLVHGDFVVREGLMTGELPGRVIRSAEVST
ncbi:MAG: D-aminoacylase [Acidobacteria bacterium]|nr:D-aminoacylase [Acidobacteriota bacterium]MBI3655796.1 D-aminoacylase [Acidobacteriota bacterium]